MLVILHQILLFTGHVLVDVIFKTVIVFVCFFSPKALNENLRIVQRECEKLKKEKSLLKKELDESIEKLRETLETNNEPDVEKRKTKVQKRFTQLFEEKLKLQREV